VLPFRASPNAFAPSAPIILTTYTPEWRDPNTNSANQSNGRRCRQGNRNNCTRSMVVWIVPLYNPLSTVQPVERYTQFNNRNPETLNHQRNQDYSQLKSSDNEVSVVLSFSASPNAFAPSSPILLPIDTAEWSSRALHISAKETRRNTVPTHSTLIPETNEGDTHPPSRFPTWRDWYRTAAISHNPTRSRRTLRTKREVHRANTKRGNAKKAWHSVAG
jgi:hypothetical protein